MSDITMCNDSECPFKEHCYRSTAPVNDNWQSYFLGTPRKGNDCEEYWGSKHLREQIINKLKEDEV
jgi:hypothetical protein